MEERNEVYRRALEIMDLSGIPYLVGGAYAMRVYAQVYRDTKDLDLFVRPEHSRKGLQLFTQAGFTTHLASTYWLAKASSKEFRVDLIFSSKNGLCVVDDDWFRFAPDAHVLDRNVKLVPVEEMIWSKAFVMERERFDGADVAHLFRAQAIDWRRLLSRLDSHWPVLMAHLVMFDYIYPSESGRIPAWLRREMAKRYRTVNPSSENVCRGPLLAHLQYLTDVQRWGYRDVRLDHLTPEEISE